MFLNLRISRMHLQCACIPHQRVKPYAMRHLIREKLMSLGDAFCIENDTGIPVYKIDGHAFTILREKLSIEDTVGNEIGFLRENLISLRKAQEIHLHGKHVATLQKTFYF